MFWTKVLKLRLLQRSKLWAKSWDKHFCLFLVDFFMAFISGLRPYLAARTRLCDLTHFVLVTLGGILRGHHQYFGLSRPNSSSPNKLVLLLQELRTNNQCLQKTACDIEITVTQKLTKQEPNIWELFENKSFLPFPAMDSKDRRADKRVSQRVVIYSVV